MDKSSTQFLRSTLKNSVQSLKSQLLDILHKKKGQGEDKQLVKINNAA